jgi:hypothetical protein
MGVKWIDLVFRKRSVTQSELYWNIVKPTRREATIEMPHSRNDHSDNRDADIWASLIEDEKIESLLLSEANAGGHLLARVELAKLRAQA